VSRSLKILHNDKVHKLDSSLNLTENDHIEGHVESRNTDSLILNLRTRCR
jgi:hypothetical protein